MFAKEIGYDLIKENFWERRKEFVAMNPAGTIPILFDNINSVVICNSSAIIEYIEEVHPQTRNFIGENPIKRAEARRIENWFDEKFYNEVSRHILNERYFNRYLPEALSPDSEVLRIARKNFNIHMNYIEYLLESRKYLACDQISVADFAAAAQISVIDYFGDVNWQYYNSAKEWYSLLKSHKIFQEILRDRISNIAPPEHYSNLDF